MTQEHWPSLDQAFAGPVSLAVPDGSWDAEETRLTFANCLYGEIPKQPEDITYIREPLPSSGAERLKIAIRLAGGSFEVDAALWLPTSGGPYPLICGLDFVGPAGILPDNDYPLDPEAIIVSRPEYGCPDGLLRDTLRGTSAQNWPVLLLTQAGYGVMTSCYGSWVPDDPEASATRGLRPILGTHSGAISLWAWAISRLIDVGEMLPEISPASAIVTGHSRLGKAALWAAANDARIGTVFASSSGAAGAAPSRHEIGETLTQLQATFPHWLSDKPSLSETAFDQHALLALAAPRSVYLAGAMDDLWADPVGSYMALVAASSRWEDIRPNDWPDPSEIWDPHFQPVNGSLGFHLRPGGHALLPYDWQQFLSFLDQRS